ncbi:MAG: hypothetical protein IKO42_00760 [Opitutales bacterium]|nr:hypothetical protein [Opitutales bacterium]
MQKKVPMWPVYAADALMFLSVFFIALPNIFLKEPLEAGQAFALVLVVLIAMCLVLLPHFFAYRMDIDSAKTEAQKRDEIFDRQLGQIFADLRTLRDSLLSQKEKIEASSSEIEALQVSVRNLKDSLENNSAANAELEAGLAAANSALENLKNSLSDFEKKSSEENGEHLKYLSDKLEKLSEQSFSKFQILDDICAQLQALGDAYAESDGQPQGGGEEGEDGEADGAEAEDDAEEIEGANAEESGEVEGEEEEEDLDAEEEVEDDAEEVEEVPEEIEEGESFGNDDDFGDLQEEEPQEEAEGQSEPAEEIEPQAEAPKINPKWEGILDKALQNSQSSSTRETVSKFIEKNNGSGGQGEAGAQANLFDEAQLPPPRKPTRVKSGDTAVIVNAFLGIGNIPYVRGEGAGLSPDKGAPMDLLEIGKYQWKCGGMIADPIKISVWLNDEIPSNLGELVLNPNETLEIDPSFE